MTTSVMFQKGPAAYLGQFCQVYVTSPSARTARKLPWSDHPHGGRSGSCLSALRAPAAPLVVAVWRLSHFGFRRQTFPTTAPVEKCLQRLPYS